MRSRSISRRSPVDVGKAAFGVVTAALPLLFGCGIKPSESSPTTPEGGSGPAPSASAEEGGAPNATPYGGVPVGADGGGSLGGSLDGGAGDGMARQACTMAGATRTCCGGTQTCLGGGEFAAWGPCVDSTGAAAVCHVPCGSTELTCDAGVDSGVDAGSPHDSGCGSGWDCKPGSIRYCDNPVAAWSKSVCDTNGKWGPCLATAPISGCGSNYAPDTCCTKRFICCQWEVNGPFVDFGGSCAALACN